MVPNQPSVPTEPTLTLVPDAGPPAPPSSTPHTGLMPGAPVQRYDLFGAGCAVLNRGLSVEADTVLRLAVYPELGFTEDAKPIPVHGATLVGVRARRQDGSVVWLSDQHRQQFVPGEAGWLWSDQWNLVELDLSELAGEQVDIELVSDDHATGRGWLQPLGVRPAPVEAADVVERVSTTRGSHNPAGDALSRGNTFPLTCVPHGFNFLTPVTDARTIRWLYAWPGSQHDPDPRPALQGLAFSHQPSPWIADRFGFQLMPWAGRAHLDPKARARHFDHEDETDQPHHYRVELEGGLVAEMTPTSRAAVFRFEFPGDGPQGAILDMPESGNLQVEQLPDGRVAFRAKVQTRDPLARRGQLAGYVYGETRQPVTTRQGWTRESIPELPTTLGRKITQNWPDALRPPLPRTRARILQLSQGRSLEVVAAMSFISIDQARKNLTLEVGQDSFEQVKAKAHDQWAELLGRLEITGGTLDQRRVAWSNLARLYAWPNEHHENIGTAEKPQWAHASPELIGRPHSDQRTGAEIVDGVMYVNNGYWDTYRTCWPAYHLFTPLAATDLINGQVAHFTDGGWTPRWCAPGYVDCMVGTSSDTIFADAAAHGLSFDELTAYDSALRNACVPSEHSVTGRKGLDRGRFTGYIDTDTEEGFSWSVENATCDAAIADWSASLATRAAELGVPERAEEFAANADWFGHRGMSWRTLFDDRVGFLQGRRPDGQWRWSATDYDPERWGDDYTETNGWGMAFHAPQDGAGLADAYGSEAALAAKLELAIATPETASEATAGSYPANMHERTEARALRLGMIAMSNQPAHHTPYMFAFTGQHHRTQWLTREIVDRLFVGSDIGQGYPGDEDNGEMSAWWLFAALGLYPLQVGSGELVITAPLFERMALRRDDGHLIEVRASHIEHRYIQQVTINGEPWHQITVPVSAFGQDILIEVELGPEPSAWAADSRPRSISQGRTSTRWYPDHTTGAAIASTGQGAGLIDDRGQVAVLDAGTVVTIDLPATIDATLLTLTTEQLAAPALGVEVRRGDEWVAAPVQLRGAKWANQTQAYRFDQADIDGVRLTAEQPVQLRQVELY